jgi:peptidoglycan/xylan/chitin deacetylase (PgdA/CDA1 family)
VAHDHRPLILAYHAVDSAWASPLAVSARSLELQAAYLAARGFVGLTLTEAERGRQRGGLPARSVVFTFDDGYRSTALAAPILAHFGFPGTVFAVTGYVESQRPFDWYGVGHEDPARLSPMNWDELAALKGQGWEVGSHTVTHGLLTNLDDRTLADELNGSRTRIAERLGSCESIAYPYGQADRRVAVAAGRAGYRAAVMLTGVVVADEVLRRPRVELGSRDRGLRLRLKLSAPGLAARRARPARLVRRLRGTRAWMPSDEPTAD